MDTEKAKRKADRKKRRAARKAHRAVLLAKLEDAVGEWHEDHKIDPDEIPAIRRSAGRVLLASVAVAVDALDGDIAKTNLRKLRSEAISFVSVVSSALED